MSHCTKFDFQYTDKTLICKVFNKLGLTTHTSIVKTSGNIKWSVDEYPDFSPWSPGRKAIIAKKNGFNYFMENYGNHYELSIEKHNMTYSEERIGKTMADEFRKAYIGEVAKEVAKNMEKQGQQAIVEETSAGYQIRFGLLYDKNILIKFENGRVIEEVKGVKGQSCVSLTEALENMMSSSDVELQSEWTEEYYEDPGDELTIYNMDQI